MSILLDENTRVIVQGMTGREGSLRTAFMKDYGTKVVAGVTPDEAARRFMVCRCMIRCWKPSRTKAWWMRR